MFEDTLYEKTGKVLEEISEENIFSEFYLAGGTALALQFGHRKSIDLDFFSHNYPNISTIKSKLSKFNPMILNENLNSLDVEIEGVKVSFLEYRYPLIGSLIEYKNIKLASIEDIACMKLTSISSRGSKKDFIDLYFILKSLSTDKLFELFKKKYIGINYSDKHIIRSLITFDEAEENPDVDYLGKKVNWEDVKTFFLKTFSKYL